MIDGAGRVMREVKVPTEPDAILVVLADEAFSINRIAVWKPDRCRNGCSALCAEAALPVICVETRHMRAVLQAQINKRRTATMRAASRR